MLTRVFFSNKKLFLTFYIHIRSLQSFEIFFQKFLQNNYIKTSKEKKALSANARVDIFGDLILFLR